MKIEIAKFGVEEWLNTWEKKADFDIAQSSIAALKFSELTALAGKSPAAFMQSIAEQELDYGWIEGSPTFKKLVSELYQHVDPEHILQTNGATGGANLLVMYALLEPGDHVVTMFPTYQQLYDIPRSLGAKVDFVTLTAEHNWKLEMEQLAAAITPATKMICLNNANNPTGTLLTKQELTQIAGLAREVGGAYVLVDEVYAPPLRAEQQFTSIADIYEKGIATNSLSKTYSLPGLRIGWVAAPSDKIIELLRNIEIIR